MKKIITLCLFILICLSGCKKEEFDPINEESHFFKAEILEINKDSILVKPPIGSDEISVAEQYEVELNDTVIMNHYNEEVKKEDLYVGQIVEIIYYGDIKKGDPAQITAYQINTVKQETAEFYLINVHYDKEWDMYIGISSAGDYIGDVLFEIPEGNEIEIDDESIVKITSSGGIAASMPPRITMIDSIELVDEIP